MTCAILIKDCFRASHWPYLCSQWAPIMSWSKSSFLVWVLVLQPNFASIGLDHDMYLVMKFVYMR